MNFVVRRASQVQVNVTSWRVLEIVPTSSPSQMTRLSSPAVFLI